MTDYKTIYYSSVTGTVYVSIYKKGIGNPYDKSSVDKLLSKGDIIYKFTIGSAGKFGKYHHELFYKYDIRVNKLVLDGYYNLVPILRHFKSVNTVVGFVSERDYNEIKKQIPYPVRIKTALRPLIDEYRILHVNNNTLKYDPPRPEVRHLYIATGIETTKESLLELLSYPYESVHIIFGSRFKRNISKYDMSEIIDALIINPVKYIHLNCIGGIGPNHDEIIRLMYKPEIISLYINNTIAHVNEYIEWKRLFNNYTILRCTIRSKHYCQYLVTTPLYERNIKDEFRFKRMKVAQ